MKGYIITWLVSVLSFCLMAAAWIYTHPETRYARVDIGSLYEAQKKILAEQVKPGMNAEQQAVLFKSATDFAIRIDKAMTIVADECKCALLNSAAIVRMPSSGMKSVQDLTGKVKALVADGADTSTVTPAKQEQN